jgi:hypothetical protein
MSIARNRSLSSQPDHQRGALGRSLIPAKENQLRGPRNFDGVELWQLPKATRFSEDRALSNPLELIKEFRRQPASQLLNELIEDSDDDYFKFSTPMPGRPRMPGDWAALYLAYVADSCVAVQKFADKLPGTGLLEACGFKTAPARQSIDLHFVELERHAEAFLDVARELIGRARGADPRIGACLFVDGTAFHSASVLEPYSSGASAGDKRRLRVQSASTGQVSEEHFAETREPESSLDTLTDALGRTRGEIITLPTARGPIRFRVFDIKGERFISRDLSSGVRWYDRCGRFWLGGYLQAAVDMYTGLPLALSIFPADVPEWDGYPALYDGVVAALGEAPDIVSVDRGFALNKLYEFNSRRGTGVVAPFRKRKPGEEPADRATELFDQHGVPRCQFCGGPGDQTSPGLGPTFDASGNPQIKFRCLLQFRPDCTKPQRLACAADYVQLPLLSRETELYHAVAYAHHTHENWFQHSRRRYAIAGKEGLGRTCRSGLDVHRLRAAAAILLDWFKISLRQGWLDPVELEVERNLEQPARLSAFIDRDAGDTLVEGIGSAKLAELFVERDERQLWLPYGPAADRLRLAFQEIR